MITLFRSQSRSVFSIVGNLCNEPRDGIDDEPIGKH
jgi:hypothetical protein